MYADDDNANPYLAFSLSSASPLDMPCMVRAVWSESSARWRAWRVSGRTSSSGSPSWTFPCTSCACPPCGARSPPCTALCSSTTPCASSSTSCSRRVWPRCRYHPTSSQPCRKTTSVRWPSTRCRAWPISWCPWPTHCCGPTARPYLPPWTPLTWPRQVSLTTSVTCPVRHSVHPWLAHQRCHHRPRRHPHYITTTTTTITTILIRTTTITTTHTTIRTTTSTIIMKNNHSTSPRNRLSMTKSPRRNPNPSSIPYNQCPMPPSYWRRQLPQRRPPQRQRRTYCWTQTDRPSRPASSSTWTVGLGCRPYPRAALSRTWRQPLSGWAGRTTTANMARWTSLVTSTWLCTTLTSCRPSLPTWWKWRPSAPRNSCTPSPQTHRPLWALPHPATEMNSSTTT